MDTEPRDKEICLRSGLEASLLFELINAKKQQKTMGVTEEELAKPYPTKEFIYTSLAYLLQQGIIKHFLSQEGTAGNFAHRYKLEHDIEVKVHIKTPAQ